MAPSGLMGHMSNEVIGNFPRQSQVQSNMTQCVQSIASVHISHSNTCRQHSVFTPNHQLAWVRISNEFHGNDIITVCFVQRFEQQIAFNSYSRHVGNAKNPLDKASSDVEKHTALHCLRTYIRSMLAAVAVYQSNRKKKKISEMFSDSAWRCWMRSAHMYTETTTNRPKMPSHELSKLMSIRSDSWSCTKQKCCSKFK